MAAAISLRTQKGRPPRRAPFSVLHMRWSLLLRITLLGRVVPRAASLIATSFVGCRRRVLSEGGTSEGECQRQSKSRNKHFHDFTPFVTPRRDHNSNCLGKVPRCRKLRVEIGAYHPGVI